MSEFIKILPAVVGIAYIFRQVILRWQEIIHPGTRMDAFTELEEKTVQSWIDGRKIPFTHYTFYKLYLDNQGIPNPTVVKSDYERKFGQSHEGKMMAETFASEDFNEDLLRAASEYLSDRHTYANFMN